MWICQVFDFLLPAASKIEPVPAEAMGGIRLLRKNLRQNLKKKIFLCYNKKTICNPNFSLPESAGKIDAFSGKDKSLSHPMYEREGATYGKTYRTAMLFVR